MRARTVPPRLPRLLPLSGLVFAASAGAATITVDNASDASIPAACSLRDAVRAANTDTAVQGCAAGSGADRIRFAANVNSIDLLDAGGGTLIVSSPLTLDGEGRQVTLRRPATQSPFQIINATNFTPLHPLELRWITVGGGVATSTGSSSGYGGGIQSRGPLTLIDCVVTNNRSASHEGGGIYAANGLTLLRTTVSGNSAPQGDGGGIFALSGMTLTQATITGNSAQWGGGISAPGGGSISDSVISNNSAIANSPAFGGGIHSAAALVVTRSLVNANSATATSVSSPSGYAAGGGLYATGGLELVDSTVQGNQTSGVITYGGGITSGDTRISGSTVSGNTVSDKGGGISAGQLVLINSTVSGNVASRAEGAGIHASGVNTTAPTPLVTLINSTVANNRSDSVQAFRHSGIWIDRDNQEGHMTSQSSLVYGNNGADIAALTTVQVSGEHNLVGSVASNITLPANTLNCNPQLRPLAGNGGITQTHALPLASCAINAGGNPSILAFDQRGTGFPRVEGSAADIGAYEWHDRIFADDFDPG